MNRFKAAIALLVLTTACSSEVASPAALTGPNSLAVAGNTLLVANSDGDTLRALDMSPSGTAEIIGAPNPLLPLSIPTTSYPYAVASFTGNNGSVAPLSFVLSAPGQKADLSTKNQITVVSNIDPNDSNLGLVSIGEMVSPESVKTIMSLAIPSFSPSGDVSLLMGVVLKDGEDGALWSASFPSSLAGNGFGLFTVNPVLLGSVSNNLTIRLSEGKPSRPQALAVSPSNPSIVAVGDTLLEEDGQGQTGGLIICNLGSTPASETRVDVGGPVKAVRFNAAGTRVFALVDANCSGQACSKLAAVDLDENTHLPKQQQVVNPDSRLDIAGSALGIAVSSGPIDVTNSSSRTVDPLVMVSSANDNIYLINGATLSAITVTDSSGATSNFVLPPPSLVIGSLSTTFSAPLALAVNSKNIFFAAYAGGNAIVQIDPGAIKNNDAASGLSPIR